MNSKIRIVVSALGLMAFVGLSHARIIGTNPTGSSADTWCDGGREIGGNVVVSSSEVCVDYQGNFLPTVGSNQNLGTPSLPWLNVYTSSITNTGNQSITGNLTVSGNTTLGDNGADTFTLNAGTTIVRNIVNAVFVATSTTASAPIISLDGANIRLGIGTATPGAALDVRGVIISSAALPPQVIIDALASNSAELDLDDKNASASSLNHGFKTTQIANGDMCELIGTVKNGAPAGCITQWSSNGFATGNTSVNANLSAGNLFQVASSSFVVKGTGATLFTSKTLAFLLLYVPATAGETFFCSNCTGVLGATGKILVSTGTSAGNFADAGGGAFK